MKQFIIKKPVVTEKSLALANKENVYTFEVSCRANKDQIRQIIEKLYSVRVVNINTVTSAKKRKKTGRKRLIKVLPKQKKVLVRLKKGESIQLFDLGAE